MGLQHTNFGQNMIFGELKQLHTNLQAKFPVLCKLDWKMLSDCALGCEQTPASGKNPLAGSQPRWKVERGPSSATPAVAFEHLEDGNTYIVFTVDVVKGT